MRLFRGLSEAIIGKCLTVECVGYVEDPSLVSAFTTPFQSSADRSTSGMGQGPFVMDCGALEDVLRGARAGAILLFYFFFFHFPVSQCTYVSVRLCLQFSDRCRHICPTCVRKLGPLIMLLIRRKTLLIETCRMKCQQARSQGIRKGGYILRGVWGSSPRKFLYLRWRKNPNFNDFLQLPKKFRMSNYLLLMTEMPDLLQAAF